MSDHITEIPLADLTDSPTNPRQRYSEVRLQELADNVRANGRILSPLLVRPIVPALFKGLDDPDAQTGFEIVFGHRRRRAAELAGLTTAPCVVRSMTDAEVKLAQVSENLQRDDVHPFEEAEGFQALMKEHGHNADQIAAMIGKSRSYVYGRVKLLQACKSVREACLDGKIDAEVALLVARLRTDKLQQHALKAIEGKNEQLEDGGAKSYRSIRELLAEKYTLDLKTAIFPIDSTTFNGRIHIFGACTTCPKRSGNAPEFADIASDRTGRWDGHKIKGSPDACTDPDCYAEKKACWLRVQADELRDKGQVVIDGNRARSSLDAFSKPKGAYISHDQAKRALTAANKPLSTINPVLIQNPRDGKTVKAVAVSALKAAGVYVKDEPGQKRDNSVADWEAKRRKQEEERTHLQHLLDMRICTLRDAMRGKERTLDEAKIIVTGMLRTADYKFRKISQLWTGNEEAHNQDLIAMIPEMSGAEIAMLMIDIAMMQSREWVLPSVEPGETLMLCALESIHGLGELTESTPSTAAQATVSATGDGCAATEGEGSEGLPPDTVVDPAARAPEGEGESLPDDTGSAGEIQMDDVGCADLEQSNEAAAGGPAVWPFQRQEA